MAITDLFSKRQKRARGETPDVYVYDQVRDKLRTQVLLILDDALGTYSNPNFAAKDPVKDAWSNIHDTLAREYGMFELAPGSSKERSVRDFFLRSAESEQALDFIEYSFRTMIRTRSAIRSEFHHRAKMSPKAAVEELNGRFREHGVGYQFESGQLVRMDSTYVHSEAVKPTLVVLQDRHYRGANDEFLKAHRHYRNGDYKEASNEALKALESTLKAVCERKGWNHKESDTAKTLLDICFREGLIPNYLQSKFSALRSTLESGTPTVRNKESGHGQGSAVVEMPRHLAQYVLNLTASAILFLAEAEMDS